MFDEYSDLYMERFEVYEELCSTPSTDPNWEILYHRLMELDEQLSELDGTNGMSF